MILKAALITVVIMVFSFGQPGMAAPDPADSLSAHTGGRIELFADVDSALVFIDTTYAGRTPLVADSLPAGRHLIRILPPHAESWFSGAIDDTVVVNPGETLTRRYGLRQYIAVQSHPSGASVYLNDSLAGETPFLLRTSLLRSGRQLSLKKDGFEPLAVVTADLKGSIFQTALKAGWQQPLPDDSPYFTSEPKWSSRRVGLYVSGGTAVLAGIAAAYLKISADDRQAAYQETGNPALLTQRQRLDTWAGVSFALTQVGLAVFSYLLITE